MTLRTIIVAASVVALAVPAATLAAGSKTPVHNHATTSDSSLSDLGSATTQPVTTVAGLETRLRRAERRAASLGAQLRAARVVNARLRADLRATKQLVAGLRLQLAGALGRVNTSGGTNGGGGDQIDYCRSNMVDCTDEQLCAYWGMNCWIVERPIPVIAEPASEPTPT